MPLPAETRQFDMTRPEERLAFEADAEMETTFAGVFNLLDGRIEIQFRGGHSCRLRFQDADALSRAIAEAVNFAKRQAESQ